MHLDLDQALRVFRAATAAARAATAEGAGVPEYLALAAAALTRLGPGDDDGGETAAMLAGGLGLAATAALLPESWRRRARETLTSEAGIAAVGTAAVAGLALGPRRGACARRRGAWATGPGRRASAAARARAPPALMKTRASPDSGRGPKKPIAGRRRRRGRPGTG